MDLNYKKLGEGQPLIILHGLFGSLDNWLTLAKYWAENYEVWIIDQRNHGKSPHADEHSYELMAQDLKHFMEEKQIEDPIILGHSMGGKTAMEFAITFPTQVKALIVVDIAPVSYQVHHWDIIEALESIDLSKVESRKDADKILQKKIASFGVRQFLLKNLDRIGQSAYQWKFNLKVLKHEIEPISNWPISEGEFKKPSLFIKGENSEYILSQYGANISAKFPNYELINIENAGHWVHAEATEPFKDSVDEFLKKHFH